MSVKLDARTERAQKLYVALNFGEFRAITTLKGRPLARLCSCGDLPRVNTTDEGFEAHCWSCYDVEITSDGYESSSPIGIGSTPVEAVKDWNDNLTSWLEMRVQSSK